jgi:hypothetical protein
MGRLNPSGEFCLGRDPFSFKAFLGSNYEGVFFDWRTILRAVKSHQTGERALELEVKRDLVPQQRAIFRIIFDCQQIRPKRAAGFGLLASSGFAHHSLLGVQYEERAPARDGQGVNKLDFVGCAGLELGPILCFKGRESWGQIVLQR